MRPEGATSVRTMMHHIALCCLEGSTMSNLVHRRRRCARIVTYMILLPGGQYAEGWILFLPRIERIERIERSCPMEERRDKNKIAALGSTKGAAVGGY